jgi:hypothetical protein
MAMRRGAVAGVIPAIGAGFGRIGSRELLLDSFNLFGFLTWQTGGATVDVESRKLPIELVECNDRGASTCLVRPVAETAWNAASGTVTTRSTD